MKHVGAWVFFTFLRARWRVQSRYKNVENEWEGSFFFKDFSIGQLIYCSADFEASNLLSYIQTDRCDERYSHLFVKFLLPLLPRNSASDNIRLAHPESICRSSSTIVCSVRTNIFQQRQILRFKFSVIAKPSLSRLPRWKNFKFDSPLDIMSDYWFSTWIWTQWDIR